MLRLLSAARGAMLSLMLLGLGMNAAAAVVHVGAPQSVEVQHDDHQGDDHHGHHAADQVAHHADLGGGLVDAILDFLGGIADVLLDKQYCGDCGYSDSRCQCDCWSGNPRDGECGV